MNTKIIRYDRFVNVFHQHDFDFLFPKAILFVITGTWYGLNGIKTILYAVIWVKLRLWHWIQMLLRKKMSLEWSKSDQMSLRNANFCFIVHQRSHKYIDVHQCKQIYKNVFYGSLLINIVISSNYLPWILKIIRYDRFC